jgi:DNA-binding PadR family transcriptional regulator
MFRMHRVFQEHWGGRTFQKGDLKYVILGLIKDKPCHGYEIIQRLEERSHGFYTPSPGAVYPLLQLLEEMGYIEGNPYGGKKIYTITDEGRKFLSDNKPFAEGIKQQMKHTWSRSNTAEMREAMVGIGKIGRLIGRNYSQIEVEKMRKIRDIVSQAYREIEKVMER